MTETTETTAKMTETTAKMSVAAKMLRAAEPPPDPEIIAKARDLANKIIEVLSSEQLIAERIRYLHGKPYISVLSEPDSRVREMAIELVEDLVPRDVRVFNGFGEVCAVLNA